MISQDTGDAVVEVFRRYLTDEQIRNMMVDLLMVDGNKSFRESIRLMSRSVLNTIKVPTKDIS